MLRCIDFSCYYHLMCLLITRNTRWKVTKIWKTYLLTIAIASSIDSGNPFPLVSGRNVAHRTAKNPKDPKMTLGKGRHTPLCKKEMNIMKTFCLVLEDCRYSELKIVNWTLILCSSLCWETWQKFFDQLSHSPLPP